MTTEPMTTGQTFGERHFGRAQLGDQRRTRRLVALADQLASHPGGTLPHKVKSPKDLKALYRLCECPAVTHEAVLAPHREHTRSLIEQPQGTLRVIHDATELDYTMAKSLSSLGQIGNGHGRGYLCQNSLVVDPKTRQALGLINQVLQGRVQAPKNEAREQRRQGESRESRLWIRGTEGLPAEARLVDARRVGGWYEVRWVVEEFHKAQKAGCAIEQLQFRHEDRLKPAIALISMVALTLLNLRDASRREDAKTQPATTLFAVKYIEVLSRWRWKQTRRDLTIHDFFYALARLGGHQNRKHDHRPGWLVLWRGWTTLQAMVDGASTAHHKCGET